MLSAHHVNVYLAFGGDIDGWVRAGGGRGMTDAHWALIEELRLALRACAKGWATEDFVARTQALLMENTSDEEVRNMLRALAIDTDGPPAGDV